MGHFNVVDVQTYLNSWGGPVTHTYGNSPQSINYGSSTTNFNPTYAIYRYRSTSTGETTGWKNASGSRSDF